MRLTLMWLALMALSGCHAVTTPENLNAGELIHHRFVLTHSDGQPVAEDRLRPLELSFGEGLYVYGTLCQSFGGEGKLLGDRLLISGLRWQPPSAPCSPERQRLDATLEQMLYRGVKLQMQGSRLTLSTPHHTQVFRLADLVG